MEEQKKSRIDRSQGNVAVLRASVVDEPKHMTYFTKYLIHKSP